MTIKQALTVGATPYEFWTGSRTQALVRLTEAVHDLRLRLADQIERRRKDQRQSRWIPVLVSRPYPGWDVLARGTDGSEFRAFILPQTQDQWIRAIKTHSQPELKPGFVTHWKPLT